MPAEAENRRFCRRVVYTAASLLALIVPARSTEAGDRPRDRLQLVRLVYLTSNLDSLTRSFIDRGFHVERGAFDPLGVTTNLVRLPIGQTIELQTTYASDTTDWRLRAIRAYGTHLAGVTFAVDSIGWLYSKLTVPRSGVDSSSGSFGLLGPQPLDVAFRQSGAALRPLDSVPPNGLHRITWLLLTVSDSSEALLRQTFDDIGLTRSHAGCCDFWIVGPPSNPVGLRFELPSTTFRGEGSWLSIEDGGVVFD